MITIQGKGVSTGIGMGPLYFYRRAKTEIPNYTVEDTNAEWLRFKGAQSVAIDQLGEEEVVVLDEERKAQMVSNLLVVLCGNKDAQPIVNSGSIY